VINVVLNFGGKMTQTQTFITHLFIVALVTVAAIVLAIKGTISGATATALIVAVSGVSLGAVVTTTGSNTANAASTASTLAVKTPSVAPTQVHVSVDPPAAVVPATAPPVVAS
jgi:hypothetical protein